MNLWDILILAAVALLVFFAVRAIRGGKSRCSSCRQNCADCCACEKEDRHG